MKRIILGCLLSLVLTSAFLGLFFFGTKMNTSIVEDLPILPVAEAGLCASDTVFEQADFSSSSCIQPVFDFYIVHVSDDVPQLGLTLSQKVQRTKAAFNAAKTRWSSVWTSNNIPPVVFSATYTAVVPSGTQVNIPNVSVIHIPQEHLTYNYSSACANPHKICYVREDISNYLSGDTTGVAGQMHKLSLRNRGATPDSPTSGIGLFETTLKHNTNVPVLVVDKVTWYDGKRAGWTDTEYGVINLSYLGFQENQLPFDQEMFNRTLAHELGHILGLGESDGSDSSNLMTQMVQGGTGHSLKLYQAARAKASLCSPGLRPEKIGSMQKLAINEFTPSCAGDKYLHSIPGLDEQCTPGFSGSTTANQFLSTTIKEKFCPIVKIQGTVLPTPLAVTDDPSSPHYFVTVVQNNPGAQVKMCNVNSCRCEGLTGSPGATPTPHRPFVPQDTVPVSPGGNGGSYPVPTAPSKPIDCTSYSSNGPGSNSCPASAWCPSGTYCTAGWDSCACVPNACGNGQVDASEECDGSAPGGNSCPYGGSCNFDCTCSTVQPGD